MPTPIANSWFQQAFYQETPDAFWRLGDAVGATLANDQSLNAYNATVAGGVTFGQTGFPSDGDKAALFNGTTGYLNAGLSLAYQFCFTAAVAFKTSDATHTMGIVGRALSASGKGWALLMVNGALRFLAYDSTGAAVFDTTTPAATYADGSYHFAEAVYDPLDTLTATVTIDGTLVRTVTPAVLIPDSNAARLLIGAWDNAGTAINFWNGTLDEVILYGNAFTATQRSALYAARAKVISDRATLQARSLVMRSGASRSYAYAARSIILLNGVDVNLNVEDGSLRKTDLLNEQPDTSSATLFDKTGTVVPVEGQSWVLADGATDNPYFTGTIVNVKRRSVKNPGGLREAVTYYDIDATDGTWLLNRRTVTAYYAAGQSASLVVASIINGYTSGFTTGSIKSGAPTLTAPLVFIGVKVGDALTKICQSLDPNWHWYPGADSVIHFFDVELSQRPKSIVPGVYNYDSLSYARSLTQIRTRMLASGGGAKATAPIAVGATSAAVDECGWYAASGGTIVTPNGILVTYTGVSATSGPGSITGIPPSGAGSLTVALLQGDQLNVWVSVDDASAQASLALLEGGDGIHEQYLSVSNGTIAACTQAANAELAAYADVVVTGNIISRDKLMRSGKVVSIALPSRNITVDVVIQQVTRRLYGQNLWEFDVTFATVFRNFIDVLKRAKAA